MAQIVNKKFKVGDRVRYVDRGDESYIAAHVRFSPNTTYDVCIEFDTGDLLVTTEKNLVLDFLVNKNGVRLKNGERAILLTTRSYSPLNINAGNIVVIEDSRNGDKKQYGKFAVVRSYFDDIDNASALYTVDANDLYPINKYAELLMEDNANKLIKFIQKCVEGWRDFC